MHEQKHVISVVLVAVRKKNKILLLKREKEPLKGYFGLVGGKLKSHESIADCAVRETKEETGLDSEFVAIRGVLHERLFDKNTLKYGLVLFFVEVKPKNSKLIHSDEGKVGWFEIDKIKKKNIILSDLWMIKNLLSEEAKVYNVIMKEKKGKLSTLKVD